jgi:N-methylhydantoinase A
MEEQEAEFLYWRIEASADTPGGVEETAVEGVETDVEDARHDEREAYFDGSRVTSPAYRGDLLGPGHSLEGPAVVDAKNSTVVLPPGAELTVTDLGNFHILP